MIRPHLCLPVTATVLLLLLARAAAAQPSDYILPPDRGMQVRMEILVDGRPVSTISHAGRTYLPVPRLGAEYEIRLHNDGPRRISAVVSVDGLSVITRRLASVEDAGYIVEPYGHIHIRGWRQNESTMSVFRFEDRSASHAATIGHAENIGVIGLVAFEEAGRPRPRPLLEERQADAPMGAAEKSSGSGHYRHTAPAPVGETGTASGRDIYSPTQEVPFVRSGHRRSLTIYYDTPENLRRGGVSVDRPWPEPFPGSAALDTRGW